MCAANSIRKLNSYSDFGEQCHTNNSEPYFYESAYLCPYDNFDSQLDSTIAIPIDRTGICYVAGIVDDVSCIDRMEECHDDSESATILIIIIECILITESYTQMAQYQQVQAPVRK